MRRKTVLCFVVCSLLCLASAVTAQDIEPTAPGLKYVDDSTPACAAETAAAATAPSRTWAGLRVPAEFLALTPEAPTPGVNTFPATAPPPPSGVRKVPLIIGIAGAVVMVAGIVVATEDDSFLSLQAAGVATAVVGGAVAATGFYFAFRR